MNGHEMKLPIGYIYPTQHEEKYFFTEILVCLIQGAGPYTAGGLFLYIYIYIYIYVYTHTHIYIFAFKNLKNLKYEG